MILSQLNIIIYYLSFLKTYLEELVRKEKKIRKKPNGKNSEATNKDGQDAVITPFLSLNSVQFTENCLTSNP